MSNTGPLDPVIKSPQDWIQRLRRGTLDIRNTRPMKEAMQNKITELEKKIEEDAIKDSQRKRGRVRKGSTRKSKETGNTV